MMRKSQTLLLIMTACMASSYAASNAEECTASGFTPNEVKCSDCEAMQEMTHDKDLHSECKKCCVKDEVAKFVSAELQVCPYRLSAMNELKSFIDKDAKSFRQLKIKQIENTQAKLKLKRQDGTFEIMRVDSWKRDAFREFITDRVI